MDKLFFSACILITAITALYAYILLRGLIKKHRQVEKIYIDTDGAYVIPPQTLLEIMCAQINDCIHTSSQTDLPEDADIMKIFNNPRTLAARRAAAVMITIDACWSCLDASNENTRILCDALVSKYSNLFDIDQHLPHLAEILENQEDAGATYVEIAKYIAHIANSSPGALKNLLLTVHAKEEVMLILEVAANLFKTIKIEDSGRIIAIATESKEV